MSHDEYLMQLLDDAAPSNIELAPLDVSEMDHAILGASSSHRWMACPGSLRLIGQIKKRGVYDIVDTSDYSKEGTLAHALGEACLRNNLEPHIYTHYKLQEVTEEMADAVQIYVDYCRKLINTGGIYYIEQAFDLGALKPPDDMFGTVDFVWWNEKLKVLEVVDYKHGVGVPVSAVDNSQLLMYATGALLELGISPERIFTTIIQPRRRDGNKIVWTEEYTPVYMEEFEKKLIKAANRTAEPDAPLSAGEHCQFCTARAVCRTTHDYMMEQAREVFEEMPSPEEISSERVAELLHKKIAIYGWFRSLTTYAEAMLLSNQSIPGWKLIHGNRRKVWVNEREAKHFLHSIGLNSRIAPATALTALAGALPRDLWKWEKGKRKAVPSRTAGEVFTAVPKGGD